jgi:enoyl-CoA hydratase/carnithine racemase
MDDTGDFAGVVTVTLEQPGRPVVVLDHDLLRRLEATLRPLVGGEFGGRAILGLVLASASRVFIAGADLKSISEWEDEGLHRYLEYGARVFGLLSKMAFPTSAAIGGAALGGGLEIAMHCDGLIGAPPGPGKDGAAGKAYPVGLPEAGLGLCPGWGGTNLLPARMDPAEAIRLTASGKTMGYDEAAKAGLFDAVAPDAASLLATAKGWVASGERKKKSGDGLPLRWIGRTACAAGVLEALDRVRGDLPDTGSARAVARAVDAGLSRGWGAACAVEREELVRLRHTPEAKGALEAFFAKSK